MVTAKQLRERSAVLQLRQGSNQKKLTWLVNESYEYDKLVNWSVLETVNFMMHDKTIVRTDDDKSYVSEMEKFIRGEGQGFYSVGTIGQGTIVCSVSLRTMEIEKDERQNPMIDYLIEHEDAKTKKKIWYQELRIIKPRFLGVSDEQ